MSDVHVNIQHYTVFGVLQEIVNAFGIEEVVDALNDIASPSKGFISDALFMFHGEQRRDILAKGFSSEGEPAQLAVADNSNEWKIVELGQEGEHITCLAKTKDIILFAGSSLGNIYKSVDFGDTWELVCSKLIDYCMTIFTSDFDNTIYISSKDRAIKSEDLGRTWDDININWGNREEV